MPERYDMTAGAREDNVAYGSGQSGRHSNTRHRIQVVALDLFTTQGFEKTSLREIAERLGVTKAALYYHFASKGELIQSLLQPLIDDIDAAIAKAESATEVRPREVFGENFDMLQRHLPVFQALMRDASAYAYVDIEQRSLEWLERMEDILVGKDAPPAARVRAGVAFAGLSRAAIMMLHTDLPSDVVRAAAIDAACAALGVDEASPVGVDRGGAPPVW